MTPSVMLCSPREGGIAGASGMNFRVTGQNRETGARQFMEFEAENRAAAERKASQAGMSVTHLEVIATEEAGAQPHPRGAHRGEDAGNPSRGGCVVSVLIFVAIA